MNPRILFAVFMTAGAAFLLVLVSMVTIFGLGYTLQGVLLFLVIAAVIIFRVWRIWKGALAGSTSKQQKAGFGRHEFWIPLLLMPILIFLVFTMVISLGPIFISHMRSYGVTETTINSPDVTAQDVKTEEIPSPEVTQDANHEAGFVYNSFYTKKCPFVTYSMALGSTDGATEGQVSKVQMFLKEQNMFQKSPTGTFDQDTLDAVAKWQRYIGFANQIKNPGTIGPITQKEMNRLCVVRYSGQ